MNPIYTGPITDPPLADFEIEHIRRFIDEKRGEIPRTCSLLERLVWEWEDQTAAIRAQTELIRKLRGDKPRNEDGPATLPPARRRSA